MNIQFGCGSNSIKDWNNHDAEVDVSRLPLPYGDNRADVVLAEHLVEHLSGPDCLRFFEDVWRILKPGGILRVCVPVLGKTLEREHVRNLILGHGHLIMFNEDLLHTVFWAAGFVNTATTGRKSIDGHWRAIGAAKDDQETCRVEGTKP